MPVTSPERKCSSQRWVLWLAVATPATAVIIYLLIWYGPDVLARHDIGNVTGPLRVLRLQQARDAARGRLLTLGAGLFAAGALIFTAQNYRVARQTLVVTEQGQVTDRYTKAIEQLGSEKLDVRIGGIYALERVASDSARDHPTVMEVLAAFVREHSREQWPPSVPGGEMPERSTRPDVQAAITVIGRRDVRRDRGWINLAGADLTGADLDSADLSRANLTRAKLIRAFLFATDLTHATLTYADVSGAKLWGTNLTGAALGDADLSDADLSGADLTDAKACNAVLTRAGLIDVDLTGADLDHADLTHAILTRAILSGADLDHADFTYADLTGTDLTGVDLSYANFTNANFTNANITGANLSRADLTGARWSVSERVPKGWVADPGSGRLTRADVEEGG